MTRRSLSRRLTAILLVLALAIALVPAALAAASCPQCGGEVQCTDNGDGRTHTLYCPADGYTNRTAAHTFASGRCTACGAMDYSQVRITLPTDVSLTAALRDSDAAVSLEGVSLTLGTEDVTGEYTLSYSWYYNGNPWAPASAVPCLPPSLERKGTMTSSALSLQCPAMPLPGRPSAPPAP